jgi:DNA-binding SARP family transcriptional activator
VLVSRVTLERVEEGEAGHGPGEGGEIEVAVLGPTEVRGIARGFSRASALELVVYLALHPAGVANDAWATALWPDRAMAPATLHSTASVARRALGRSASGRDHLPRSHGRLRLATSVSSDWSRFSALAASDDLREHRDALSLVRGRPFEGLRNAEWTVLEGIAATIEERVAEVACRVVDDHLARREPRAAAAAARRGLAASPYDERLYRRLLRCADEEGHPAGVERVMAELLARLDGFCPGPGGVFDLAAVHPETASLYGRLSRRRRPDPGPSATTN